MMRSIRRVLGCALGTVALGLAAFLINAQQPRWRAPEFAVLASPARQGEAVRVLALNIAKAGFHSPKSGFASRAEVLGRLDAIADVLLTHQPDIAFLSEVNWSAFPTDINQVEHLASTAGMHAYAYADAYRFGVPWFEIRSGNAILSKLPLRPLRVDVLPGDRSIFNPTNNRSILWCEALVFGEWIPVASVRNDSFDLEVNDQQVAWILERLPGTQTMLAGDFNALPRSAPMQRIADSGLFVPVVGEEPTYPGRSHYGEAVCLDYILAPSSWTCVEYGVARELVSDHLAVVATYRRAQDNEHSGDP